MNKLTFNKMTKSYFLAFILCIIGSVYYQQAKCSNCVLKNAEEELNLANSEPSNDLRNWQEVMTFPTLSEIEYYDKISVARSPYVGAWFDTQVDAFTQISIDFKADYIPSATYCSPVNFSIDYSSLLEKYDTVYNDGYVSGYCGLQRQNDGTKYNGILSLWDTYCKKTSGEIEIIRAKLIQPQGEQVNIYDNEGNGVSYRPYYPWKPRKWYRMLLQLGVSETTGNTTIEQWIGDISEKKWERLCVFDLGAHGLKFKNNIAVFLENFDPKTAGEIRTMEIKNIRIYSSKKQSWVNVYSGYFYNDESNAIKKSGTYQYGADNDSFWFITTGVPNCAKKQEPTNIKVNKSETGNPLKL